VRTSSRILAVVVFGLCWTAAGTPAYAHNALTSSDPSFGTAGPPGWWPWLVLLALVAVGAGGLLVARRGRAGGGLTG
jgi:hypothetical protein